MRIVSWNVRRAGTNSAIWRFLLDLKPNIALLQEVRSIPDKIFSTFEVLSRAAIYKNGRPQRFSTAVLVKGRIIKEISLKSKYDWVNKELDFFKGNFISCMVVAKSEEDQCSFSLQSCMACRQK